MAGFSSSSKGPLSRGYSVNLTPESQAVLNRLGLDSTSAINEAVIKLGAERGIVPAIMMTPTGIGRIELQGGEGMYSNTQANQPQQPQTYDSFDEIEKQMAKMMKYRMMRTMMREMENENNGRREKKDDDDGMPNINKLLQMQVMKSLIKGMSGDEESKKGLEQLFNSQIDSVKKEINDNKRWEELVKSMKQEDGKFGFEDFLKLYTERDKAIEISRMEADKAKNESLVTTFNSKIERMGDIINSRPNKREEFSELADTLKAVKEIAAEIKGENVAKSKHDVAKELIAAAMPAIAPLAQAAGHRIMQGQYYSPPAAPDQYIQLREQQQQPEQAHGHPAPEAVPAQESKGRVQVI